MSNQLKYFIVQNGGTQQMNESNDSFDDLSDEFSDTYVEDDEQDGGMKNPFKKINISMPKWVSKSSPTSPSPTTPSPSPSTPSPTTPSTSRTSLSAALESAAPAIVAEGADPSDPSPDDPISSELIPIANPDTIPQQFTENDDSIIGQITEFNEKFKKDYKSTNTYDDNQLIMKQYTNYYNHLIGIIKKNKKFKKTIKTFNIRPSLFGELTVQNLFGDNIVVESYNRSDETGTQMLLNNTPQQTWVDGTAGNTNKNICNVYAMKYKDKYISVRYGTPTESATTVRTADHNTLIKIIKSYISNSVRPVVTHQKMIIGGAGDKSITVISFLDNVLYSDKAKEKEILDWEKTYYKEYSEYSDITFTNQTLNATDRFARVEPSYRLSKLIGKYIYPYLDANVKNPGSHILAYHCKSGQDRTGVFYAIQMALTELVEDDQNVQDVQYKKDWLNYIANRELIRKIFKYYHYHIPRVGLFEEKKKAIQAVGKFRNQDGGMDKLKDFGSGVAKFAHKTEKFGKRQLHKGEFFYILKKDITKSSGGLDKAHEFLDLFLTKVEKYMIQSYIITGRSTNKFGLKLNNDSWRDHNAAKDNNPYQEFLVHPKRILGTDYKSVGDAIQLMQTAAEKGTNYREYKQNLIDYCVNFLGLSQFRGS